MAASGGERVDDGNRCGHWNAPTPATAATAATATVRGALYQLELMSEEAPHIIGLMHDECAPVQRLVDQLRAGVKAESLGKLVDLVTVEVPGACVLAGVEVAGKRSDLLADVDGGQVGCVGDAGSIVRRGGCAGAEEHHGKSHQTRGLRVDTGRGDADSRERRLFQRREVVQRGFEFLAWARLVGVFGGAGGVRGGTSVYVSA